MRKSMSSRRKSLSKVNSIIFKRSGIPDKRFKTGFRPGPKLIDVWDIDPFKYKRPSGYIPREEYIKIFEYLQKVKVNKRWPMNAKAPAIARATGIELKRTDQILGWMERQSLLDSDSDSDTWKKRGINKDYYTYYIWDSHFNEDLGRYSGYLPEAKYLYDMLKRGARIMFKWLKFEEGTFQAFKTPILYKPEDKMEIQFQGKKKGRKKKFDKIQLLGVVAESLGKTLTENDSLVEEKPAEKGIKGPDIPPTKGKKVMAIHGVKIG